MTRMLQRLRHAYGLRGQSRLVRDEILAKSPLPSTTLSFCWPVSASKCKELRVVFHEVEVWEEEGVWLNACRTLLARWIGKEPVAMG